MLLLRQAQILEIRGLIGGNMLSPGLEKIKPDRRDYSILHTYGVTPFDAKGLPSHFSIYNNIPIPNQNDLDTRFSPPGIPLPFGCTAETATFDASIQDGELYDPFYTYVNTPPGTMNTGRDMRLTLSALKNGFLRNNASVKGVPRKAYFNVYGTSKIDDYDAAKIAIWINQGEKRGVWIGTWWYWSTAPEGILQIPSFRISEATLHCWLITGWTTINGKEYLEGIPWIGKYFGDNGKVYVSREIYNALMGQPYTGAFTITKFAGNAPIPVGFAAIVDHLVYFLRSIFYI